MRRFALLLIFVAFAGGVEGCGSSGPSPAIKQAEREAHQIVCGEANLIGGQRKRECEHPAEVKAEWQEYQREHPAAAKAQEEEAAKGEAAG